MRRRLALLSVAISSIVVIAFLVPLGILVRNQAQNRALTRAERFSQSVAAGLGVAGSVGGNAEITPQLALAVLDAFGNPAGTSIVFTDGTVLGEPYADSPNLSAALGGRALVAAIEGGAEVLVPVVNTGSIESRGTVVVRSFVSSEEMSEGVALAWAMLVGLGLVLIAISLAAADRMSRAIVEPVDELSAAARRMGEGELDTRVEPSGPDEIAEVGEAFNFLARRLGDLLEAERESVADLSHRLRTPLAALRLQVELVSDRDDLAGLVEDVDRLEAAINGMIEEARSPQRTTDRPAEADLGAVVEHRAAFWQVLADEQGRSTTLGIEDGLHRVPVSPEELGALVDVLIGNIFTHTDDGVGYRIRVRTTPVGQSELLVEDEGTGFPAGSLRRGQSSSGSTGLGLDIVARIAERAGGSIRLGASAGGGATVTVRFSAADQPAVTEASGSRLGG